MWTEERYENVVDKLPGPLGRRVPRPLRAEDLPPALPDAPDEEPDEPRRSTSPGGTVGPPPDLTDEQRALLQDFWGDDEAN